MSSAVGDAVVDVVGGRLVEEIGTTPNGLTELWANQGGLLPRLLTLLRPQSAAVVVDTPAMPTTAYPGPTPVGVHDWTSYPTEHEAIIGVLPWRWAAERAELRLAARTVTVVDDPAHIALLRACRAMPVNGVAVVVAGLAFMARPGPATAIAQFDSCGLAVRGVVALPPRMFTPRAATGRLLITIRRVAEQECDD